VFRENLDTQVIYGVRYVDEIVRFEKQDYGTMIVFQDANWNVTSLVNLAGTVLERVYTTPYGQPTFDTYTINGDYDGDGDIDPSDDSELTTCLSASPLPTACLTFDYDNDGDVDAADNTRFDEIWSGSGATDLTRQMGRTTSGNLFTYAHQGLLLDEETNSYQNRHRQYLPEKKRFAQRDPIALLSAGFRANQDYADGLSLHSYLSSNPIRYLDTAGLTTCGSGSTERLVPDNPGYNFSPCCVLHDDCYASCICKETCDANFFSCMLSVCEHMGHGLLCACIAMNYYWAVRYLGDGAYMAAQDGIPGGCQGGADCPPAN
jgi:RHS repeat-associated protein